MRRGGMAVYDNRLMDLPGFSPGVKEFVKPKIDKRHKQVVNKIINGEDVRVDFENRIGFYVRVGPTVASGGFESESAAKDYMALLMKDAGK